MKASHVLYQALGGGLPGTWEHGRCQVCGGTGYPIVAPVEKLVSDNWTGWSALHPGDGVCQACATLLKDQRFRHKNYIASPEGVKFLQRGEFWEALQDPPEPPFVAVATTSNKKQLWIRAPINWSRDKFIIQFELAQVVIGPGAQEIARVVARLRNAGISAHGVLTGSLGHKVPAWAWEVSYALEPLRRTPLLEFLVWALTKEVCQNLYKEV